MKELIHGMIGKVAAAADAAGLDLSPEETAAVAYRKIAQDSAEKDKENGEAPTESEEEKPKEEGEEKEAQAILKQAISDAVSEAEAELPEGASAADLAKTAEAKVEAKIAALAGSVTASDLREKQAALQFQAEVVKLARDFLAANGFDPDTGKPISKVALAKTAEEQKQAAALELLESRGWPVTWDPAYLARAVQGKE